ncbi:MAG: C/D box methylation guide ribonucleoprotein complex aNOP56 subunit [Candidatus Bathyarchaeia archaeon]
MKATIIVSMIGILAFREDGNLIEKELFQKDAVKTAEKLMETESGKVVPEIIALIKKLRKKGYSSFVFESPSLSQKVKEELGIDVEVATSSKISEEARENLGKIAVETGFVKEPSEMTYWIHNVSMELSRIKVRKATEKRDLLIVQAIQAVDDVDKTLNLFMGRIREWYGLHFPELDRLIEKHETYARLLRDLGERENFTTENLEKAGLPKNKASQVANIAKASMGASLHESDIEQIQAMCIDTLQLYETRDKLEKYVDDLMAEVAPNIRALIGSALGARLIGIAGGLNNLAKMPASTIQVLGAEKALFRSLTTGARPPKHGIIFQHILIREAKRWLRGKIARALAGKLTIAVRTDAFSGNYVGDKLKEDLQKRIEEIEKKYPESKPKPSEKRSKKKFKEFQELKRRRKHGRKD